MADDKLDMREYVRRLLNQKYEVVAVNDGEAALRAARASAPDLVLTDVMMPGLDGFGLLKELRADERLKTVPVIMLSARAGEESRVEGMEAGADDYLIKPFSARELMARVSSRLELARLRAQLDQERAAFINLFSQSPIPMAMMRGNDLVFDQANRAYLEVSGGRDILGKPLLEALPELEGQGFDDLMRHVMETGVAEIRHEALIKLERRRGEPEDTYWTFIYAPLHNNSGQIDSVVAICNEVTEPVRARQNLEALAAQMQSELSQRKRVEESLERLLVSEQAARREAEEASRLKDDFLATVSHELRTPLNAILGWTQILQSSKLSEADTARAIQTIHRNAKSQAQLIEDLLDVSRIITGKMRLDIRPIHLEPVIRAAIDSLRPAIDLKSITLETALGRDADQVPGDPNRLQQVVWNLLSNAVKFTPEKGKIEVRLERVDSTAQITISDTGRGIRADFLPYIFDRFRQADSTTTRKHGGLGLGLAIVRHLAELHGGTVHAASGGEGRGASFTLRLPMAKATASEMNKSRPGTGPLPHAVADRNVTFDCPPELNGLRVLLVDDQPDALDLLKAALAQCGAEIKISRSAIEAIEAIRHWRPDILVSDIAMPGEDGYSLISKLRAMGPEQGGKIPALALTAYARVEDRMRVLSAGFQMYLPKPVELSELLASIARLAGESKKGVGERA